MRRIIQSTGAEVIHLGHSRSVGEVVEAAIEEDAQAVAVTSYQGGHMEFFTYMVEMLRERGCGHVRVFGGGGGVIQPDEIDELRSKGVAMIYSPDDGRRMGLQGMINHLMECSDFPTVDPEGTGGKLPDAVEGKLAGFVGRPAPKLEDLHIERPDAIARMITLAECNAPAWQAQREAVLEKAESTRAPVVGVTGTGGAGKSSLVDELARRFLADADDRTLAVLSADPTKRKTGGALLGDRIRMNAVTGPRCFMRSLATRGASGELPKNTGDIVAILRAAGVNLIYLETTGIGQGASQAVDASDVSLYVMTAEYGAASQLEKIDMLDYADVVAINKFERQGSEDALRDVQRQYRRNHLAFETSDDELPVFGTMASQFSDPGVNALHKELLSAVAKKTSHEYASPIEDRFCSKVTTFSHLFPPGRVRYLSEISESCRAYRACVEGEVEVARKAQALDIASTEFASSGESETAELIEKRARAEQEKLSPQATDALARWPELEEQYSGDRTAYEVRGKQIQVDLTSETLAGTRLPKVVLPKTADHGEILRYLMLENVPGGFPYTAGVFPFRRQGEDPRRQFAGEGGPNKTNTRFHYLSRDDEFKRLSTAFDSVTLYGEDPHERPDIWGKVGESGVSICSLDDMKKLYDGFELTSPKASVSMTINGPAPILLAQYFNTAYEHELDKKRDSLGREPSDKEQEEVFDQTVKSLRGTVQADILKEDQAQNTCIFSTDFALRMMGDIQQWFNDNGVRNYYSVSISGYHMAEAGANPITQAAFTLANGFTYVEYYLSRGMPIDSFAPNLSFFFSNGMDAEYTVIGRAARRIWSVAMRDKYGANERSQKLKYHIQTSGRSLHAQEIQFNDIRTTCQALLALYDACNSLHTNSYDEAITTPTEESVRRAIAVQLIIQREMGLSRSENLWQGSYAAEWLTDNVEEAILTEFDRLASRGGVLGAMELQYQRGKIQDESMKYESMKHSGSLPIIGVNSFLSPELLDPGYRPPPIEVRRSDPEEKNGQLGALAEFRNRHEEQTGPALERLKRVALQGGNIFGELVQTVRVASLGQITAALYEVGGQYRRSM